MTRTLLFALAFIPFGQAAPIAATLPPTVPAGFHQVHLNGHVFTLPEGFTIELAAKPPLVERPIVAAFDEKGRLYVCDSSGSNEKTAEQVTKKPHRIVRLEDTNGDAVFDKSVVFVPNIMLPEGAMWLNGSLYVAAPPQILKFTDTDGDGKADKEEVWFDGKTLTGCANDLHGPYLGLDGWIYWCKGAFAKQEYTLPNGKQWSTRASHIFRARPDGSSMEPVMSGGMDNPVDVVFTPSGERIFSTTFFQHPANGQRDGLIHAVYGGVYGKDHDPIHEHPWTSPSLMPNMTHLGPAAPCGLHRYESDQFGKDFENNIFCCQFNMRKVSRHVLTPNGSTFTTKDSDFVVSDNLDFHPTDVIEDADGSLLIVDTGGWYKLCCPTSQLVKTDVSGAIYRVKKIGAHKIDDPRGLKIAFDKTGNADLIAHLNDLRPVVRQRAIESLADRGEAAAQGLAMLAVDPKRTSRQRLGAIWALARIEGQAARQAVRTFLHDTHASIQCAAVHVVSLRRDRAALGEAVKLLKHDSLPTRRVAAEALGRIGDAMVVASILDALADEKNDRVLDHSLTYALIEIGDRDETMKGLTHDSPRVRRAALAALEGMPNGHLDAKTVITQLTAKDSALRETAWWIAARHPQWGDQLAEYFGELLATIEKMTAPEQDELSAHLVPFLKSEQVRKAVGYAVEKTPNSSGTRSLLHAMARSGLKTFPGEWKMGILNALTEGNGDTKRDAIALLRAVPPTEKDARLLIAWVSIWSRCYGFPKDLDYALRAVAPVGFKLTVLEAAEVIADVHRETPRQLRAAATELLSRAALAPESLVALAGALKTANPVEVGKLLPAFAKSNNKQVGRELIHALSEPAMRTVIRLEVVKPMLDKYPESVREEAEKLYALLAEARRGEREKLERLAKDIPPGDIRRGQLVFNGNKGQCVTCHKIGYVGGTLGPDLTRIGGIRNERDLLESIVLPSASFVRSYEPVKVTTTDGRTLNGILKKDAPDEIVLAVSADKEERVARGDVEEITQSTTSVMPAGFDQQLSLPEIADLIAFLRACR